MSVLKERPKQLEHEIFRKIFDVAELANMDEVKRSEILRKMTTERDLRNQMAYATQVGREEGLEEGRVEIAKRLKEMGMSVSDIVSATGLDPDTVSSL